MADDDWLSEATADEPPAPVAESVSVAKTVEEVEEEEALRRRQLERAEPFILYKSWKRPVFMQYSYLYDYRHNYYDDVIDYLDRRQRGIFRDIPRPQTWAERALRTYTRKVRQTDWYHKREKDISLLSDIRTCARFYNYHSKDYINTKY